MIREAKIVLARGWLEWRMFTHRPAEWVLLSGNRLVVTTLILLGIYLVIGSSVAAGFVPLVEETSMLFVLFALISGNFTLIAIVVSLSQFVLARHLETPGEIRNKINEMIRYRQEVGETAEQSVIPVAPSHFFQTLFESIRRELAVIDRRNAQVDDETLQGQLDSVVDGLGTHTQYVIEILQRPETGLRHALYASLSANYERYIHVVWSIQAEQHDQLSASATDALDRLVTTLEQVDIARRTFKSVFIQSELASLSRLLLLIGIPTVVVLTVVMLMFSSGTRPIVPTGSMRLFFPLVIALGLAPIVLLAGYIVRLATVAHRTAAVYPFSRHAD